MEAEFCLPRHLRANPIFSADYNRPPPVFAPTRFLSTRQDRVSLIITSGFRTSHITRQRFFHRPLSPHESFPWPHNALPAASAGDTRASGDSDAPIWSWARSTATTALVTTAVIIAAGVVLGRGIRLKGAQVEGDGVAMAGVMATQYPAWLNMPVGARAVQALLDTSDDEAPTQEDVNQAKRKFTQQIQAKKLIDYRELQEAARVLIKSSEAKKMMQVLQNRFEDLCDADEEQDAVEMGLILAEMQIYQGNFKEAVNILHYSFYNSEMMTKDVRPDLYRVAANLLWGNKKEALKSWDELKSKEDFMYPPTPTFQAGEEQQRIPSSISEFEVKVRKRKANILKARKSRPRSR